MTPRIAYGEGRETLIGATVSVVAERGLRGLTFRAVAEKAGVNNSLVAHHFGSRDALLAAAMEWAVERSIESTGLLDMSSEEAFTDALVESITTQPELQAFQYEMILEARRNPLVREPVQRLYDRYEEVVSDGLRKLGVQGDVTSMSRHFFAALDGLVLQHVVGIGTSGLREAVHDVWVSISVRGAMSSTVVE